MIALFNTIVFDPLYNLLVGLYATLPVSDLGVAIILLTVLIKFLLAPLSRKQIVSQKKLQALHPKIKALQEKHKEDKQEQQKALMELYRKEKVNPFAGCMPLILQLIIFLAIYRVIIMLGETNFIVQKESLYSFVPNPETLSSLSLGFLDLSVPNYVLAILAAGAMYYQSKMLIQKRQEKKEEKPQKSDGQPDFAQMMTKQMLYIGPIITLIIGFQFAAGLTLYWFTSILFTIAQQKYLEKKETS